MQIMLLWLLISVASDYHGTSAATTVAKFSDKEECQRVATTLNTNRSGTNNAPMVMCIQAKVVL